MLAFVVSLYFGVCLAADTNAGEVRATLESIKNNKTALNSIQAPPWVSSPDFRGTSSILWSCIVTLFACIYTALHLNVPTEKGVWAQMRLKLRWVFAALLAPEVVLYIASTQFIKARWLQKELNRLVAEKDFIETSQDVEAEAGLIHQHRYKTIQKTFDLKYCFFVVMGGLQVDIDDIRHEKMPSQVSLTAEGIVQLAKEGHWFNIPTSKIDDKSKADIVQKWLVVIQVSWMAIQCIVRRAIGLPISLLEIHTMVHVVCAIVMYSFWFKKPVDLRDSEVVDTANFRDSLALMVEESDTHIWNSRYRCVLYQSQLEGANSRIPAVIIDDFDPERLKPLLDHEGQPKFVEWISTSGKESYVLKPGQAAPCGIGNGTDKALRVAQRDLRRWETMMPLLDKINGDRQKPNRLQGISPRYPEQYFHKSLSEGGNLVFSLSTGTSRSLMSMSELAFRSWEETLTTLLAFILPFLYGGVHLTAWAFEFPSAIESLLWKIACIIIMATIPLWWVINWISNGIDEMDVSDSWWEKYVEPVSFAIFLVGWGIWIPYAVARCFIIVESFISLRAVPIGVFWTPAWLQMIPHL